MVKSSEIPKAIKNPRNALKVARSRFNFTTGKILFKNTAGLEANLNGRKSRKLVEKYHNKFIPKEHQNPKIVEFQKNGFVDLGNPFDKNVFQKIKEKYNQMIEDDRYSFVRSQYQGEVFSRMLNRAMKLIPEFKDLITNDLLNMFEEHFRGNFQIIYSAAWRNYHVPPEIIKQKEIFSSGWHCDGSNTEEITLFINLSDVNDDNDGPFHLQSKERTKELVRLGFKTRQDPGLSTQVLEDPNHVKKHIGPAGSAVLGNSSICMHRAGIPAVGHKRDIMQFRIIPSIEPLRDDWQDHCEESLMEIKNQEVNVSNRSIT